METGTAVADAATGYASGTQSTDFLDEQPLVAAAHAALRADGLTVRPC